MLSIIYPEHLKLIPVEKNVIQSNLSGDTKFTTVTLEVDPKQAQDLIYLNSTQPGNLFMVLRNPNDRAQVRYPSSTMESVAGLPGTISNASGTTNPLLNLENPVKYQNGKAVPSQ
jgi:hypothetical protein